MIDDPERGSRLGGAIIGFIQGDADDVPIVCQADASVVEIVQLLVNLFQALTHR